MPATVREMLLGKPAVYSVGPGDTVFDALRLMADKNIGAVIVLFLFGIMITRAPTGLDVALDNDKKLPAALISLLVFAVLSYASITTFGTAELVDIGTATDTATLAQGFVGRFVVPFEVVGFILLAALVGGIAIARRDLTPLEEEARRSV